MEWNSEHLNTVLCTVLWPDYFLHFH